MPSGTALFFNTTATTEIYTLSLHDALPISDTLGRPCSRGVPVAARPRWLSLDLAVPREYGSLSAKKQAGNVARSEEHTSELQSQFHLVCRLLLEKKKSSKFLNYKWYTACTS